MNVCDKCGTTYEERRVLIKKNGGREWARRKATYNHLCEDCGERYWSGDVNGFTDSDS